MRRLFNFLRDNLQAMRRYFTEGRDEIAEKNLRLMRTASLARRRCWRCSSR